MDSAAVIFIGFLIAGGAALMLLAAFRARSISRTYSPAFVLTPMRVVDVNLVPIDLTGEPVTGALTERTSMVLINYVYTFNGQSFQSRDVFPLRVEWMRPRVSPFKLFEDLKSGRISSCYVDSKRPSHAVIFKGWTPYLRSHVVGVTVGGLLTVLAAFVVLFFNIGG
jgi:hypothetical protein